MTACIAGCYEDLSAPVRFWLTGRAREDRHNPFASRGAIRYNRRIGMGSYEYPVLADEGMGISRMALRGYKLCTVLLPDTARPAVTAV